MADWKPPKFGSPVWMGIPATDVDRGAYPQVTPLTPPAANPSILAAKFYGTVFNFTFKPESESHPASKLRMFDFKPDVNLSGGIHKVSESTHTVRPGHGGVCMHWFVEDVQKTGDLIEQAGGKMLSGVEKEGKQGIYRYFEDTEGSVGSIYQMVESNEGM
jgi:predicted enzyme related to lactoylglutathione lyase